MKKIMILVSFMLLSANLYADEFEDSEKACERGSGYACYELGLWHSMGMDTRKDLVKGFKYYQKSCEEGNAVGCSSLADCYVTGEGTDKDLSKGKELYQLLCDNNFGSSCKTLDTLTK